MFQAWWNFRAKSWQLKESWTKKSKQNVAITEKDRIKSPLEESLFSSSFIISPKKTQNRRDSFFLFPRTIPDLDRLSKLIVMTSLVETFKTVVSSIKYETYIFNPDLFQLTCAPSNNLQLVEGHQYLVKVEIIIILINQIVKIIYYIIN